MLPALIGIAGEMQSGKDTAAQFLAKHYGYTVVHLADALREEAEDVIRMNRLLNGVPLQIWEDILLSTPDQVYQRPYADSIRRILQWYGTEYRRAKEPDYWLKRLEERLDPEKRYVVPDIRFLNEEAWLKKRGGVLWMIDRPGAGAKQGLAGHSSEAWFSKMKPHLVLDNSGTLEHLGNQIDVEMGRREAA